MVKNSSPWNFLSIAKSETLKKKKGGGGEDFLWKKLSSAQRMGSVLSYKVSTIFLRQPL